MLSVKGSVVNMKVVDLTHIINNEMPVYPGTEKPRIEMALSVSKDGFQESRLNIFSHVGTHMDAPAHMLEKGAHLNEINIENFVGKAVLIDVTDINGDEIKLEHVQKYSEELEDAEFVVFKTGWSKLWEVETYYQNFPVLSTEAAKWLLKYKLKAVGVDAISVDKIDTTDFEIHHILLENNILIIENLTNLDAIKGTSFTLCSLPLKYENADGAPTRVVGII